jgi:hypothetical protein
MLDAGIRSEDAESGGSMRIFICGIIQGSHSKLAIHEQTYRQRLKELVERYVPDADVYCPQSLHPESLSYGDDKAFDVFEGSVKTAGESELLIAYLPEASMGSAIEMWEAKKSGARIISISPMKHNWVVRYASDMIFESIEEFAEALKGHKLGALLH